MKTTNEQVDLVKLAMQDVAARAHMEVPGFESEGAILAAEVRRLQAENTAAESLVADLREYAVALACEWTWKRESTPANDRQMAALDAAISKTASGALAEIDALRAKVAELEAEADTLRRNAARDAELIESLGNRAEKSEARAERLADAIRAERDADHALRNREYAGINGEPHDVLRRRHDEAIVELIAALAGQPEATTYEPQDSRRMDIDRGPEKTDYRTAAPGTFGRAEWLDLLMACQDGRATCMRVVEIIEREMGLTEKPEATAQTDTKRLDWLESQDEHGANTIGHWPRSERGHVYTNKRWKDGPAPGSKVAEWDHFKAPTVRAAIDAAMAANGGDAK